MPTRGESAARQKYLVTLPELIPGVLDAGAKPVLATDINTDGSGLEFLQRYSEHRPDGFLSILGAALVGDEGQISGTWMPHYGLMVDRLRAVCGAPVTTTLTDGRTKHVFKLPENGQVNRETFSGFYGNDGLAYELLYGKITSLSMESTRSGDVTGSISMHFNRVRRGMAMYANAPTNAVFTVTQGAGVDVGDDVVINVSVNGGAAQQLTIEPDALQADVQDDVIALSNITSATVSLSDDVYTITITGPANTRVSAYKVSGDDWTVANTVVGSDGLNLPAPAGLYIESSHGLFYKATNYADLQSIDMGDDEDWNPDDPHIVRLQGHSFSLDGLVNPVYLEDRSVNPTSHVDGETNISATYTLPEDSDGPAEDLFASTDGCTVTPFYGRQAWRCGPWEFWFDLYGGRTAAPDANTDQNIAGWVFNQSRFYNENGSAIFTVITPS